MSKWHLPKDGCDQKTQREGEIQHPTAEWICAREPPADGEAGGNSQQADTATNQTPSSLLKKAANCISQSAFSLLQGTPPHARRMVAHSGIFFQPKLPVQGAASTGEGAEVSVQKVEQQIQPPCNSAGNDRAGFNVNTGKQVRRGGTVMQATLGKHLTGVYTLGEE